MTEVKSFLTGSFDNVLKEGVAVVAFQKCTTLYHCMIMCAVADIFNLIIPY